MPEIQFVTRREDLKIPQGGLVLVKQKPEDHIMGSTSPIKIILRPDGQHDDYLPVVEIQRVKNGQDTYGCVSFSRNNCLEIVHKEKYGYEINMDDQFLTVGSGTQKGIGNSVVAPAEWGRVNGFIKEKFRILEENLDQFYTPVTAEELQEGQDNLKVYQFKYAWLPRPLGSDSCKVETLVENLKFGPIQASVDGSAYQFNQQGYIGVYGNLNYDHEITIFGYEYGRYWKIFDSETQQALKFAWNYPFGFPMIHDITKLNMPELYKKKGQSAIGFVNEAKTGIRLWKDGEDSNGLVPGGEVFHSLGFNYALAEPCDEWPLPVVGFITVTK